MKKTTRIHKIIPGTTRVRSGFLWHPLELFCEPEIDDNGNEVKVKERRWAIYAKWEEKAFVPRFMKADWAWDNEISWIPTRWLD